MEQIRLIVSQVLATIYIAPFIAVGWTGGFLVRLVVLAVSALREGFEAGRSL